MRRIGRYILNGLTGLSLVLCVATVGLWVRSYWKYDQLNYEWITPVAVSRWRMTNVIMLGSGKGEVYGARILSNHLNSDHEPRWSRWVGEAPEEKPGSDLRAVAPDETRQCMGITWCWQAMNVDQLGPPSDGAPGLDEIRFVAMPHAYAAALFATPPIGCLLLRLRRLRRRARGACEHCGYDLRATPDRCPECGTIPTKVKA